MLQAKEAAAYTPSPGAAVPAALFSLLSALGASRHQVNYGEFASRAVEQAAPAACPLTQS